MEPIRKFRTFEDLEVYKCARDFRRAMYGVARTLPEFEKFGLVSQIRRAAVSLTNNIAEGHGRWHYLDHIKFVLQARGSLEELVDDLNVCEDEKYLSSIQVSEFKDQGWHILKLINGYLRWLRDSKVGEKDALREDSVPYGDSDDDVEVWIAGLPLS